MFGFQSLQINPEKVLSRLKDFELFCLGKKELSPEQFKELNKELSVSAVLHIGKRSFRKDIDGKHLIWTGMDEREHDLGPVNNLDVVKEYPGFHRTRSLSLGHDRVTENEIMDVPRHHPVTIVKLADGSTGIAPNYKMALRNAALKMHLKEQFNRKNRMDIWTKFYGHA